MKPMKTLIGLTSVLSLAACATVQDDIPRFEQMSCSELSYEQGIWKQKLDTAKSDMLGSTIVGVFGNKKERKSADIDVSIAEYEVDNAKEYIAVLEDIRYKKHCPY